MSLHLLVFRVAFCLLGCFFLLCSVGVCRMLIGARSSDLMPDSHGIRTHFPRVPALRQYATVAELDLGSRVATIELNIQVIVDSALFLPVSLDLGLIFAHFAPAVLGSIPPTAHRLPPTIYHRRPPPTVNRNSASSNQCVQEFARAVSADRRSPCCARFRPRSLTGRGDVAPRPVFLAAQGEADDAGELR